MTTLPSLAPVRATRRAAIARVVVSAIKRAVPAGDPEPGLPLVGALLADDRSWEADGHLGFAAILAVHCRAMFGPVWEDADAASGVIRFGHTHRSTGDRHVVDAQEVPLVPRTWGQAFGATIARDHRQVADLWRAAVDGEGGRDRARELLDTAFCTALPAVASVRCTCGECFHG